MTHEPFQHSTQPPTCLSLPSFTLSHIISTPLSLLPPYKLPHHIPREPSDVIIEPVPRQRVEPVDAADREHGPARVRVVVDEVGPDLARLRPQHPADRERHALRHDPECVRVPRARC